MNKVLILAGIHGNWPALQAVLRAEKDVSHTIFLGNLAGDGPNPVECVNWGIRHLAPGLVVQGERDRLGGRGLTRSQAQFLAGLPVRLNVEIDGGRWHLSHAPRYSGHRNEETWKREIQAAEDPQALLFADSPEPYLAEVGETILLNPGSVGKSPHRQASYAVWRDGEFALRHAGYDHLTRLPHDHVAVHDHHGVHHHHAAAFADDGFEKK